MKWKVKAYPRRGDKRLRRRFAVFPTRLSPNDERTVVWLRFFNQEDEYYTSWTGSGWRLMDRWL